MTQRKFTIMVPVEVTLHNPDYKLRWLYRDFQDHGPYPAVSGSQYSWRARFDKVPLRLIEATLKQTDKARRIVRKGAQGKSEKP